MGLLFSSLASGLEYLHALGFVHRDVKPDNILMKGSNAMMHFKLADFGFSNTVDQALTFCASPLYMAPEIHMRERQTSSLDIYSLGVVLFEVWGCFRGTKTPTELPREGLQPIIWEEAINFLPGRHESHFVRRMISRDPIDRPTATHCLEYLTGKVVNPSKETLRIETKPKTIPDTEKKSQQLQGPNKSAHDDISQLRLHNQVEPRSRPQDFPWRYPRTGLVRDLATAARPQQVSPLLLEVRTGSAARLQRRTQAEGLQTDDLVQVAQILRATRRQVASRDRDRRGQDTIRPGQTQPNVVQEQENRRRTDDRSRVLEHRNRVHDGKVVKNRRKIEPERSQKHMPGAWID